MRRIMLAIVLIISAIVASGCFGAREVDEVAYVLVMGFDKSKTQEGKYDITFQIAAPRAIAGESAKGEDVSKVLTLTTENLTEARTFLNSMGSRSPIWSHIKVIVIGDELAHQGLENIIGPINRFREFRGSMYIVVVNGDTAQNFIRKNKPKIDIIPSRFYETMMLSSNETSYYPKSSLHYFYSNLKSGSAAPLAALGGVPVASTASKPSEKKNPPNRADNYKAGSIPQVQHDNKQGSADSPVEMLGSAVFRRDKMVGSLNGQETRLVAILNGDFRHGFLSVDDPLEPTKNVNVIMRLGRGPKLSATIIDGKAYLKAKIFLEGELTSVTSGINYENSEYRPLVEQQVSLLIKRDIIDMLIKTQGMKADVAGFGYHARSNFRTLDEFMNIDWEEMYSQAEIEVEVETKIRRTGLMWRTMPISE